MIHRKVVCTRDKLSSLRVILRSLWDYNLWPHYLIGLFVYIVMSTVRPSMILATWVQYIGFQVVDHPAAHHTNDHACSNKFL